MGGGGGGGSGWDTDRGQVWWGEGSGWDTSGGGSIQSSPLLSSALWRAGLLELLVENSTFRFERLPLLTAGE